MLFFYLKNAMTEQLIEQLEIDWLQRDQDETKDEEVNSNTDSSSIDWSKFKHVEPNTHNPTEKPQSVLQQFKQHDEPIVNSVFQVNNQLKSDYYMKRLQNKITILLEKLSEELSHETVSGEDYLDLNQFVKRKIEKKSLKNYMINYKKEKIVLAIDQSGSCNNFNKLFSQITSIASKYDFVEIYVFNNAMYDNVIIGSDLDDCFKKVFIDCFKDRHIIYFSDFDGMSEIIKYQQARKKQYNSWFKINNNNKIYYVNVNIDNCIQLFKQVANNAFSFSWFNNEYSNNQFYKQFDIRLRQNDITHSELRNYFDNNQHFVTNNYKYVQQMLNNGITYLQCFEPLTDLDKIIKQIGV